MSLARSITLFFIFTLLFVIVKTPSALLVKVLPLPNGVAYQGLQGSIWQGTIAQVQINKQVINSVKWQFQPLKLFTGNLAFAVTFGNARQQQDLSGRGLVSIGLGGQKVEEAVFRMPASDIKPYIPFPMGALAGRIIANVQEYRLGQPVCEVASGDVSWNQAGVDINGNIEFGSIDAALGCEQGKLLLVFNGENSLGLAGQAVVESGNKFGFDGFLKPSPQLPGVVHQGISLVAKMDAKGRYKISL